MISGIIMASGFSRRMKQDKLLMKIDEVPMVERIIKAAKASKLEEIILVYRSPEIKALGDKYNITTVFNPDAHLGQSAAIKWGVKSANIASSAYLFMVGDQPLLEAEVINKLLEAYEKEGHLIVVPTYKGKNSNPVLFDATLKEELLAVEGDQGGRSIIEGLRDKAAFIEMDDVAVLEDIDSMEGYLKFKDIGIKAHK